jgi:hypothetical protein
VVPNRRPIGYWLKRLDQLIELSLDRTLVEGGVSRREWQVMNLLHDAPAGEDAIVEALRPFWTPGAVPPERVIGELENSGLTERDGDDVYRLTERGEAARAAVAERVQSLRTSMTDGLTAPRYAATVDALRLMAENLERAA